MGPLRKLIYCCLCIEEEEESEHLLSSDLHARSQLVSPLSAISSGNTASFNDSPNNSYLSAEKKKATGKFSDTATKKVFSANSSASKEKLIDLKKQPSVHFSDTSTKKVLSADSYASKEKRIYPQKQEASVHLSYATIKNDISNWKIFLNTVAAHLESSEEHETRYTQKSMERHSGPHDKVATSSKAVERRIQDYCSSQKILLVGEGDFSFSACLAKAFGSAENIVATSLNSEAYLRSNYKNAMDNIFLLKMRGCQVFHEVDATYIKNHKLIKDLRFDRIIYNFPHTGDFSSTKIALRKNQRLVKWFMENCVNLIEEKGEIHIRHKSNPFFRQWNLKGLASEAGLVLIEEAPFEIRGFRGYDTKYGFKGDNNFDCHPSCTYKFVLSECQKKLRRQYSKLSAYEL